MTYASINGRYMPDSWHAAHEDLVRFDVDSFFTDEYAGAVQQLLPESNKTIYESRSDCPPTDKYAFVLFYYEMAHSIQTDS